MVHSMNYKKDGVECIERGGERELLILGICLWYLEYPNTLKVTANTHIASWRGALKNSLFSVFLHTNLLALGNLEEEKIYDIQL